MFYSENKHILQLVALLERHGVQTVVLCPGSRNAPLVHTMAACGRFRCLAATDERSAGFMALGSALADQAPAVVCCTSGTALLNLHPAVCEAFYQQVPLIVLSADRPAAWIGQMDGQTLPQPGVFGMLVKRSVQLPEGDDEESLWYANRMINEALLETTHRVAGPVHINLPLHEPLFRFTAEVLPEVRRIERSGAADMDSLRNMFWKAGKRMIVCGQLPFAVAGRLEQILTECGGTKDVVWLSEPLSNLSSEGTCACRTFDAALYAVGREQLSGYAPDLLVTFGGHIVSKRLKGFLRRYRPREHWHVAADGAVTDLFCALTRVVETEPEEFVRQIYALDSGVEKLPYGCSLPDYAVDTTVSDFAALWQQTCAAVTAPQPEATVYSSLYAVGELLRTLPEGVNLHLANSSSVRVAALYPLPRHTAVYCNRGTSGIEGSLSTAIGIAAVTETLNFIIIGDLSFFYDMNALWNTGLRGNVRILLLNNRGGGIFNTLPGLEMASDIRTYVGAAHETSARGWAEERGFTYLTASDKASFTAALPDFVSTNISRPILFEVFTDTDRDAAAYKDYFHGLK